jgi:hypothetical protein
VREERRVESPKEATYMGSANVQTALNTLLENDKLGGDLQRAIDAVTSAAKVKLTADEVQEFLAAVGKKIAVADGGVHIMS